MQTLSHASQTSSCWPVAHHWLAQPRQAAAFISSVQQAHLIFPEEQRSCKQSAGGGGMPGGAGGRCTSSVRILQVAVLSYLILYCIFNVVLHEPSAGGGGVPGSAGGVGCALRAAHGARSRHGAPARQPPPRPHAAAGALPCTALRRLFHCELQGLRFWHTLGVPSLLSPRWVECEGPAAGEPSAACRTVLQAVRSSCKPSHPGTA